MMKSSTRSGNILFYVLIAIVLIGLLTAALKDSGGLSGDVDRENAAVKATQILKFAGEISVAAQGLIGNGVSEGDIRIAHPSLPSAKYGDITTNPQNQIFSGQGGRALYRPPPAGVNDGSAWIFDSQRAFPQIGSSKPELYAQLTYVNKDVCLAINRQLGFSSIPSANCSTAITPGFLGTYTLGFTFTTSSSVFSQLPAAQFCISCSDATAANYYFFSTLLPR